MLLFCPCEHVEGVVNLPERAKQPGLGDDGGRSRRAGPPRARGSRMCRGGRRL